LAQVKQALGFGQPDDATPLRVVSTISRNLGTTANGYIVTSACVPNA